MCETFLRGSLEPREYFWQQTSPQLTNVYHFPDNLHLSRENSSPWSSLSQKVNNKCTVGYSIIR